MRFLASKCTLNTLCGAYCMYFKRGTFQVITNSTCTCTYNGYPVPVYTISFGVTQKLMFLYVVEEGTQYLLLVYLASNFYNITINN